MTTATAERTFSVLRRVKSYLRSTMTEERLSGVGMMAVNRERAKKIDVNDVIDELAKTPRRLNFLL